MSRSNPTPTNPARYFMSWAGGKGELNYYDKEKKENIPVQLPFEFMVLDQLSTITGYSKRDKNGYYSNEVRNVSKEEFIVKVAGGVRETGLYKDLTQVRAHGASYAKSVYIAYKDGSDYVIGNIKMAGSALSAWIEFTGTCVVENGKVTMSRGDKQESPVGDFYPPAFKWEHTSSEEDGLAINLDKELQVYLSQYLAAAEHNRQSHEEDDDDSGMTGVDMSDPANLPPEPKPQSRAETTASGTVDFPKDTHDAVKQWENDQDAESQSLYDSIARADQGNGDGQT